MRRKSGRQSSENRKRPAELLPGAAAYGDSAAPDRGVLFLSEADEVEHMTVYRALNDVAYNYLRDMIYRFELEYNQIYSETKLAAQISVSRTPMRDALNRLAHERYIDILPNRGFMLHLPTESDITEAVSVSTKQRSLPVKEPSCCSTVTM